MSFEFTVYATLSFITGLFALMVAGLAWSRREMPGGKWLVALMVALAVAATFMGMSYAAVEMTAKIFWTIPAYVGILSAPIFFLLLALAYGGMEQWISRRNIALWLSVPLVSIVIAMTDRWHHLLWTGFTLTPDNLIVYGHGIWFWIGLLGYSSVWMLVGTLVILRTVFQHPGIYLAQALAMALGACVPWLGVILYAFDLGIPGFNSAIGLFSFSGALFLWSMYRQHLFDLTPVAYHTVIASMDDAMFVLDRHDRVVDLNAAACQLAEVTTRAAVGKPLAEILPTAHEALRDASCTHAEFVLSRHGDTRQYDARLSPLSNARGKQTGRVMVLRDMTMLKQAHTALQRAAILEERERMASELHDNLGQVLSYLALNAQATRDLIEQNNLTAALGQLDALSMAAQSANRNVREYILDMQTSFSPAQGFTAVLKLYLARLASITGLQTQLSLPADSIDDILPALAYANLFRIIQEALANARKHAGVTQANVMFMLTSQRLQVVIADQGVGFANDAPAGFGLDIMRARARQANGNLEIRSAVGEGTQVIVEFARAEADTVRAQLNGWTVLLVDDHALFTAGIKNLLTGRGLVVVGEASNGEQALELAAQREPNLVLLDVNLPGTPGTRLIQPLKQASPNSKVVMLSMTADDAALVQSLHLGADGYLVKSQPPAELFAALVALRRGETALAPGLAHRLAHHLTDPAPLNHAHARQTLQAAGLSALQVDILAAMSGGQVYKAIAADLHITESAVKYHAERIQSILKVADRSAAIAMAYQLGLVADRRAKK
jgi:PAS domain S-box-containing protein